MKNYERYKRIRKTKLIKPKNQFIIGYLCGLIDGEGSFGIYIAKGQTTKIGYGIYPVFSIRLSERNNGEFFLNYIKNIFKTGTITRSISWKKCLNKNFKDSLNYRITGINDCIELAEFLEGKLKIKQEDFKIWKKILYLIKNKKHLTKNEFLKIARLRDKMNITIKKTNKFRTYNQFRTLL